MSKYHRLQGYQVLLKRAQHHKDNPTNSEQKLLTALTQRLPHLEFQFQVVMIPFIVDFVSIKKKVILEVDGSSHVGKFDSDETRQINLERDGYSFLRFEHNEVMTSIDQVIDRIEEFCKLSYRQRRRFSTPKAIYVPKGSVPYVVGEKHPFTDLDDRMEIEAMLSKVNPFDTDSEDSTLTLTQKTSKDSVTCNICREVIIPSDIRIRDRNSTEITQWVHKSCRR